MRFFLALVLIIALPFLASSQFLEEYHTDNFPDKGLISECILHNGFIYYYGKSMDDSFYNTVIRKVDTTGNVIWSVSIPGSVWEIFPRDFIIGEDDFLYFTYYSDIPFTDETNFLWKINLNTGFPTLQYNFMDTPNYGGNVSDLIDYNVDTLLFIYFSDLGEAELGIFNKNSNQFENSSTLSNSFYDFLPVLDQDKNIYFFRGDSIIKAPVNDLSNPIWSSFIADIGTTSSAYQYNVLHFDETESKLYGFGKKNSSSSGSIFCMDALTGNIEWSALTNSSQDVNFSDMVLKDDYLYVTWKHSTIGASGKSVLTNKLNKYTGETIWETQHTYAGNTEAQAALDIQLDINQDVFLTGYFNATGNYGPGDWGIMKLNGNDGSLMFSTLVTNDDEYLFDLSTGVNLFTFPNKTIVLGHKQFTTNSIETYIEIDNLTGEIITEKNIGGKARLPAKTTEIGQFEDGVIVKGEQLGRYIKISFQDELGNIFWDTLLNNGELFELHSLEIIDNQFVAISGFFVYNTHTAATETFCFLIDRTNLDFMHEKTWWKENEEIEVVDVYKKNTTYYVTVKFKDGNDEGYNIYRFNHSSSVSSSNISPENNITFTNTNNRVMNETQNSILVLSESGIVELNLQASNIIAQHDYPNVNYFNHFEDYDASSYIACGISDQNQVLISKINKNDLSADFVHELPIQGTGVKWIQGENDSTIYILSNRNKLEIVLSKFDVENQFLHWSQTLFTTNGDLLYSQDIGYNSIGEYISMTGYSDSGNKKILISFVKPSGELIGSIKREGNFQGENQGLTLFSHLQSDVTILGGRIKNDGANTDAFAFHYNQLDLEKVIKGQIFMDTNQNGIKDSLEVGIPLGDITMDDSYQIYPDNRGCFNSLLTDGQHSVLYNLPPNWILTTDSTSYSYFVDNSFNNVNDTLFFGISPIIEEDKMETFTISQPLVCNQEIPMFLYVKNSGTSFLDASLEFIFDGDLLSSSYPYDSIHQDTVYWSYENIPPGVTELISLNIEMPGVDLFGENLEFSSKVFYTQDTSQMIIDSSQFIYRDILLCSYDPNDKQVTPSGLGEDHLTLFGQDFYYTIRFQNTGNYLAYNVEIRDTLDENLDLSTFQFLAASHEVSSINRDGNNISFLFNDINLPDSLSNEPESHGFVSFRIKPKEGLPEGTIINNTGHIYFDFNPAIVTNTTSNQLVPIAVDFHKKDIECFGVNDGQIRVSAINAIPPYSFLWSTGSTADQIENLSEGNYSLTITDGNNIDYVYTFDIQSSAEIWSSVSSTPEFEMNLDGTVSVNPSGGNPPFSFTWNTPNQDTTAIVEGLSAGIYTVTISDANHCTKTDSVVVEAITNINELEKEDKYLVFPNPSSSALNIISLEQKELNLNVRLSDCLGKSVTPQKVNKLNPYSLLLDISNLPTGVYFFHFDGKNKSFSKRFVKI